MWLAEKLLGWAFDITPWDEEGQKMRRHIAKYYLEKIAEAENWPDETN